MAKHGRGPLLYGEARSQPVGGDIPARMGPWCHTTWLSPRSSHQGSSLPLERALAGTVPTQDFAE